MAAPANDLKPLPYQRSEELWKTALQAEDVHVWCVSLNSSPEGLKRFEHVLSPDERERAARYRFAVHRDRFIAGRAALRHLLAAYTGTGPAQIQFREGPHGKPALADTGCVKFNASHSGDLGLYAVAYGREVGVDIEEHRVTEGLEDVASHYFAPAEQAHLKQAVAEDRPVLFFRCWTRKEAYVKALGTGLSCPLSAFCVSLEEEPTPVIQGAWGGTWRLFDITPSPGYSAALVTEREPGSIFCSYLEDPAKLA
jgi:4'-phosphopantetheinyl transferase